MIYSLVEGGKKRSVPSTGSMRYHSIQLKFTVLTRDCNGQRQVLIHTDFKILEEERDMHLNYYNERQTQCVPR